jgi:uncharacterized protein
MKTTEFSDINHLPGTITSRFDMILRLDENVQRIPGILFAAFLLVVSFVPNFENPYAAIGLWAFFLGDWALLAGLPRAGKSFGPDKPPAFLLALLRLFPAFLPYPLNWAAQGIGTALVLYAFWIEPHKLSITRQSLASNKIASNAPPLRILHLGDLHMERITLRERELLRHIRLLDPDLILFSGDLLNLSNIDDPVAWEHARIILRNLEAPLGVYAVTGSPPVDQPKIVERLLDGLDVRCLRNERISLNHRGHSFDLVGITCTHRPTLDRVTLDEILGGDPDNFTILLYHTPGLAPDTAEQGVDLQLSGHTHGGQVRLPFFGALYTSSLYGKKYESGRYSIRDLTLYVTRGIGLEGRGAPRARFLCPPEIILWEITGKRA